MNYGIGNVKGKSKSLFTTTTAPTESGGVITLATTDIVESGFKVDDYLAYVDNGNISALYSISAISSGTATLSLIGNFGGGGGKQLYQHNIEIGLNSGDFTINLIIVNESNTQFTKDTLISYFADNSISWYKANGNIKLGSTDNITIDAISLTVAAQRVKGMEQATGMFTYNAGRSINPNWAMASFTDTVITL